MDFWYDGQLKRYLTQFIRAMSNFSYKDAKGQLVRIPVRYGDMNRQVAQILKKNSENTIPSAPFIACYIKDIQFDMPRLQDPTFVSKMHVREREFDAQNSTYLSTQGANYTIERIMPSPYQLTLQADIWTTNTDQKMQLWEQIAVLFNPSLEIQTTDNYVDWTSLSVLTLDSQTWSSRAIPQGVEQDIDILTMVFKAPIWITPPAKVKKLGIITKIITDISTLAPGEIERDFSKFGAVNVFESGDRVTVTPGNFDLLVLNNVASLVKHNSVYNQGANSWLRLLDLYPGKFRAGLSQLRLQKADGNDIVAYISIDPQDDTKMNLNFDADTIPSNTVISGRGTVDAIINPETFNPVNKTAGTRYLILGNINTYANMPDYDGPNAWKNSNNSDFQAHVNDIIEWSGTEWVVVFEAAQVTATTYVTNSFTGVQYKWTSGEWIKSFEGIYDKQLWRLIL
jgi:hypothetical protein